MLKSSFQTLGAQHFLNKTSRISPRSSNFMKQSLIGLLKQCKVTNSQISKLNIISEERQILNQSIALLKPKIQEITYDLSIFQNQLQSSKVQNSKLLQRINQLSELINQQKLKEVSLKISNQNLQKQCQEVNEKLLKTRKEIQQLDNQLFKKSKESSNITQQNKSLSQHIQLLSKELKQTISGAREKQRELERTRQNFKLQQFQIFKILEIKQQEIQQLVIKNNFSQQEYQIIQRQYLRWKQRYLQEKPQIHSSNTNKQPCYDRIDPNQQRIRYLTQQIKQLGQKFRIATQEKSKLYTQLEQIKQLLSFYGIQYDQFQDAPLIQLLRKQKQTPQFIKNSASLKPSVHRRYDKGLYEQY